MGKGARPRRVRQADDRTVGPQLSEDVERRRASLPDIRVPRWGEDPDEEPRVSIFTRHHPLLGTQYQAIKHRRHGHGARPLTPD